MASRKPGIVREPNGTYKIHTKVTVNGKTFDIHRRGFATQQDAFIEKERLIDNFKSGEGLTEYTTFEYLCNQYLEYRKSQIKSSTYHRTKLIIFKHFSDYLEKPIHRISSIPNLNSFIQQIVKNAYSVNYKNKIIRAYKEILTYGHNRGIVSLQDYKNISLVLIPLKDDSFQKISEREILTKDEYKNFLAAIEEKSRDRLMFSLWGQTGVRIGEIRALQPKHFNYVASSITINQQANSKLGIGETIITTPKTKKSNRTILISKSLAEEIKDYIQILSLRDDEFLFYGSSRNIPLSENSIRCAQLKYSKLAEVPYIKPHGIRHSNTTWLLSSIKSLEEIGDVSERLGHSSKKVTLDIYFHINKVKNTSLIDIVDF